MCNQLQKHSIFATIAILVPIIFLRYSFSGAAGEPTACSIPLEVVRSAAVAGAFYPADRAELAATVDRLLAQANVATTTSRLRALVAPHAGYPYSGPVAATAYAAAKGTAFSRVMILAPSHYAEFCGVAITPAHYQTPLGRVNLDPLCDKLAAHPPFSYHPQARMHVPAWQKGASHDLRPDTFEHSLEVQLPFLQRVLSQFTLVPLLCGEADPQEIAKALAPYIDAHTLVVASSDLSHYYPYDIAQRLDSSCVTAICSLDTRRMADQQACGKIPIMVVMELAKHFGWSPVLLDYRNSGDTAGDKARVVGYAAVAFYEDAGMNSAQPAREIKSKGGGHDGVGPSFEPNIGAAKNSETTGTLTHEEGAIVVRLARAALEEAVRSHKRLQVDATTLPASLKVPKGCFVTLTKHGELRGCIGHIFPQEPLYLAVIDNSWAAALEDPRFSPVTPYELPSIEVEVSVLTVPKPLQFSSPQDLLAKLRPYRDGVVLKIGSAMATFLPQVWEQLPDKEMFLAHLSRKAGRLPDAWRGPNVSVMTYEVQAFHEGEHR
ncbi:MAG: AmmeMemoRadiSam system protein B [Candidatus Sumerlaeaceae bacterium]|jgi:AmmeMemoRadiSam system protein B/AmmeMemoRadiSam system protein A